MEIITPDELASYLRDSAVASDAAIPLLVELANGIAADAYGTVTPIPARVRAITLEVAARAYRNPEGYSSETVDDYTYRRDAQTRQAGVYLTVSERGELSGLGLSGALPAAYSVDLGSPPWV